MKAKEKSCRKAIQEATALVASARAASVAAAKIVKETEAEHKQMLQINGEFLKGRAHDQSERSRIASVIEGPLQWLTKGGWVGGEEAKVEEAVVAVELMLSEIYADRAVIAAAHHALRLRPESRMPF